MSAVDQLALVCGVAESSLDAFGKEHRTSLEVKKALLGAMGFPVRDEGEAAQMLADLQAKEWTRPLPPVLVAHASAGSVLVPMVVPQACQGVRWTLVPEGGEALDGHVSFKGTAPLEAREIDGRLLAKRSIDLGERLPYGYHRLRLEPCGSSPPASEMTLIVSPGTCWLPDPDLQERFWGIAVNLPLVRSEANWGMGDFSDLRTLIELSVAHGASAIGLNPLHAMFPDTPEAASPYSPSDRTLLNILNIDVEAIPGFDTCNEAQQLIAREHFQERLQAARSASLVQYGTVADLKLAVLRLLFAAFEQARNAEQVRAFDAFVEERSDMLQRACLFQALRAHFAGAALPLPECKDWPEEFRTFHSPAVREFAEKNGALLRFHLWLQWIADSQLKAAAEAASAMPIGLYRDLAVGAHPSGAEVWSYPESLVTIAHIGAPPDILNTSGQDWGLPPLHPMKAGEHAYQSFIQLLQSNMRYAGALRIDHAMALKRLYWIPAGNDPGDGAYVEYATEDLIGILALESHRNRCLVVGEDLGTVPEGFRERMAQANILSYRILSFEKEENRFLSPDEYPYLALSVISNHDLPTLRGWWLEKDIDLRNKLGLYEDRARKARETRADDRDSLLEAFHKEGLVERRTRPSIEEYREAANRFLARTRCLLTLVQLDDLTGEDDQVNLPGTTDEHPNWRRRLSASTDDTILKAELGKIAKTMQQERG